MSSAAETFADHFSGVATGYRRFRPRYPAALFDWLADAAPGRALAWDCATGSGQAAAGLAPRFRRVVASDASFGQLAAAAPIAHVAFVAALAAASGLASGSVDLVTVAQALHWLAGPKLDAELRRVTRPGALVAAWSYGAPAVAGRAGRALAALRDEIAPHWPPERRWVDAGYAGLGLPGETVATPVFELEARWTLAELAGYARTWSAVAAYRQERDRDPVARFEAAAGESWGGGRRTVRWPLTLIAARMG